MEALKNKEVLEELKEEFKGDESLEKMFLEITENE